MIVFVAIWESQGGYHIRVFGTEKRAYDWRTSIVNNFWERTYDCAPPPNAIPDYFSSGGDTFTVLERYVEE